MPSTNLMATAHTVNTTVFTTAVLNCGQREDVDEVPQADELAGGAHDLVGERQPDGVEERVQHEPDQEQQRRREEPHARERLAHAHGRPPRRPRRSGKGDGDGSVPDGHVGVLYAYFP